MYRRFACAWLLMICFAAAAHAQTMSHSTSSTLINPALSINCSNNQGHADNSYWRSYTLCDFGVGDEIQVDSITFGIAEAVSGNGTGQPVNVRVYEDTTPGTIGAVTTLTLLETEQFNVPDLPAGQVGLFQADFTTPVIVACQTTIVVEINTPNGQAANNFFFIGANNLGQSGPSYMSSAPCSLTVPTDTAALGFPDMQIIIDVNYTVGTPCSPCSGMPVDCHVPSQGSYELQFEDSQSFASAPAATIVDSLPPVEDTITVAGVAAVNDLDVYVDISHAFIGDLDIEVENPNGVTVKLHDNAGVNLLDIRAIYDDAGRMNARPYALPLPAAPERIMPSGPGTLADFVGGVADGVWTLTIVDGLADPSAGVLNSWELRFNNPVTIPDSSPVGVDTVLAVDPTNVDVVNDLDVRMEINHQAAGQLRIDMTSPQGTTVRLADQNLMGNGINERFDDAGPTYCDGFGSVVSGPGTMADFDGEEVGGDWTCTVADPVPGTLGEITRWSLMINPVPCDSPSQLVCTSDCEFSDVNLTWVNPPNTTYTDIEIRRDGVAIATLLGTDTAYTDVSVTPGTYQYQVVGNCDPGKGSAVCNVTHVTYNGASDVIFALESIDLIDSATALENTLVGLGLVVQRVDSFEFDCIAAPTVKRVWIMCGTFPQNYVLSAADGQLLTDWVTNNVSVYIEGVDIWGFDPPTAFNDYDGIDQTMVTDGAGDDSLVQLTGQNSTFGPDFTGMVETYNQASPNAEETDRLWPADVNGDFGGSNAGVLWTGMDPTAGPYNVAIFYDSTFSPVIAQSFEIGGFGGNLEDLVEDYIVALGGVLGIAFKRGDMNGDGSVNLQDVILVLNFLFNMGAFPDCEDAADANDDGSINLQDAVIILNYLFNFQAPPASPGPDNCGPDVNTDMLNPCVYPAVSC